MTAEVSYVAEEGACLRRRLKEFWELVAFAKEEILQVFEASEVGGNRLSSESKGEVVVRLESRET